MLRALSMLEASRRCRTGGFLAGQRAAIEALAGEHAFKAGGQALVLAEHAADFAGSTPIPGGHVDGAADVAGGPVMKAWQKRMTSASDLPLDRSRCRPWRRRWRGRSGRS